MKWFLNGCIDTKTLYDFINRGNTLKIDFTEKEFKNYRHEVFAWLSDIAQKRGNENLAYTYLIKITDVISLDGNLAHINNMDEMALHSFRQNQLAAILSILSDYKSQNSTYWTEIRSWISIIIAFMSLIISCFACKY